MVTAPPMPNKIYTQIGNRARAIREYKQRTQEDIARLLHTTRANISRKESGSNPFSAEELKILAEEFGCPVAYFFGEDEDDLGADHKTEAAWRSLTIEQQEIIKASIRAAQAVNERAETTYGKKATEEE